MVDDAYHHGNLRQALLDAGEELLEAGDASSLSLRALARTAGVSHAAPYRHFTDKAALLAALAARGFHRLTQEMARIAGDTRLDAREQFLAACRRYIELGVTRPAMYRLMFGESLHLSGITEELLEAGMSAFSGLIAALERGQAMGFFKKDPPRAQAMTVWALLHGVTDLTITGQLTPQCGTVPEGATGPDCADVACALLLSGLSANGREP